ncbi:GNAT family N-acetyltransferase [Streptomyces sp. DSM 44915]|uniref:GNAT family N-acetyltransferase n=1 Tax=Streptomyces chisholmiae TaxID=3075540 RepID=A0ABU2JWQ8_9ACTN|nr:GNAT family N-acetyltransferase [Streptomyces sp. DSM 44915]MDT0268939.1 GNAT family N-acetyltransferase [Streptomyces sp. DSM 44915]
MTTTLRPTGPEERTADQGRSRAFAITVNGRRVGGLRLATDARFAHHAGRLLELTVQPAERRRGRATVAALAAEEVLRDWGCGQVDITVPDGAPGALRLAGALGYTTRGRTLGKALGQPPPPPPEESRPRALTEAEYQEWLAAERAHYAAAWTERGVPREWAAFRAHAATAAALPAGLATPGVLARVLEHRGVRVGSCWLARTDQAATGDPVVMGVRVAPEHRGLGHGHTLLAHAERLAAERGAGRLAAYAFAGNLPATRLAVSLGYQPLRHHLSKPLR